MQATTLNVFVCAHLSTPQRKLVIGRYHYPTTNVIELAGAPEVLLSGAHIGRHLKRFNAGDVVVVAHEDCPEFARRHPSTDTDYLTKVRHGHLKLALTNIGQALRAHSTEPLGRALLVGGDRVVYSTERFPSNKPSSFLASLA